LHPDSRYGRRPRPVGVHEREPDHHQQQRQNADLEDPVVEVQLDGPFRDRPAVASAFDATSLTRGPQRTFPICFGAATASRVPPCERGGGIKNGTQNTPVSVAITGQNGLIAAGTFASVKRSWRLRRPAPLRSPP